MVFNVFCEFLSLCVKTYGYGTNVRNESLVVGMTRISAISAVLWAWRKIHLSLIRK